MVALEYKNVEMEERLGFWAGIDNIFCITQMREEKKNQ